MIIFEYEEKKRLKTKEHLMQLHMCLEAQIVAMLQCSIKAQPQDSNLDLEA